MAINPVDDSNQDRFLPKISVIVPIYNAIADLPELINCLQAQTYPTNQVEYLVVDNGSRDAGAIVLETAVQKEASQHTTFPHLQENQIQSSYAARNTGIRAAQGEILA